MYSPSPSAMSSEPSTSANGQPAADPNAEALFVAVKVLQQAVDLLPLFSEDSQLTFCSNFISGSTVGTSSYRTSQDPDSSELRANTLLARHSGKHLRHSWEHFTLLLNVCTLGSNDFTGLISFTGDIHSSTTHTIIRYPYTKCANGVVTGLRALRVA